jgi:hypothetical protein
MEELQGYSFRVAVSLRFFPDIGMYIHPKVECDIHDLLKKVGVIVQQCELLYQSIYIGEPTIDKLNGAIYIFFDFNDYSGTDPLEFIVNKLESNLSTKNDILEVIVK